MQQTTNTETYDGESPGWSLDRFALIRIICLVSILETCCFVCGMLVTEARNIEHLIKEVSSLN